MKYSVIIPIYNADSTIKKCLDSLLCSIPIDAELILINDGSTDESRIICQYYKDKYDCVIFIDKENGGVSSARNAGLDVATGEYILFVDSDDYVGSNYWDVIERNLNEHHPDMLQFALTEYGDTELKRSIDAFKAFSDKDIADGISLAMRSYMFSSLQIRTFKRRLIDSNDLRFDTSLDIGEDQAFIFSYAMHMESYISIDDSIYCVNISNQNSLSRKKREYLADQLLMVNEKMISDFSMFEASKEAQDIIIGAMAWVYYRSAYSCFKELLKFDLSATSRLKRISSICSRFNQENIKPKDIKCLIIAIPIRLKMKLAIDILIKLAR